jgi:acetolactate synthase-1/2/3 large subunit
VATLILPADTAWTEGGIVALPLPVPAAPQAAPRQIETAAAVLRRGGPVVLLLGGEALSQAGIAVAHRIAAHTGARLMAEGFNKRIARGQGRVAVERVPYVVEEAIQALAGTGHLILAGSRKPVTFFAYPGKPGTSVPTDCEVVVLARPEQDVVAALAQLADALSAPPVAVPDNGERPEPGRGALTPESVAATVAALMPEGTVIVDESISFGRGFFAATKAAPPHDWLALTGGAIGDGLPLATGAALGAPGRRVITLQADGSAMYTLQALWTQAREALDVTTVVFANRKYAILLAELASVGANPGRTALDMMDLGNPDLGWTKLAAGMGVEAARAETCERFADLLGQSVTRRDRF